MLLNGPPFRTVTHFFLDTTLNPVRYDVFIYWNNLMG